MRRREFIAGLGSSAAWPMAAPAQRATMPVIGVLDQRPIGAVGDEQVLGIEVPLAILLGADEVIE